MLHGKRVWVPENGPSVIGLVEIHPLNLLRNPHYRNTVFTPRGLPLYEAGSCVDQVALGSTGIKQAPPRTFTFVPPLALFRGVAGSNLPEAPRSPINAYDYFGNLILQDFPQWRNNLDA